MTVSPGPLLTGSLLDSGTATSIFMFLLVPGMSSQETVSEREFNQEQVHSLWKLLDTTYGYYRNHGPTRPNPSQTKSSKLFITTGSLPWSRYVKAAEITAQRPHLLPWGAHGTVLLSGLF